jgi:hypothetical protein
MLEDAKQEWAEKLPIHIPIHLDDLCSYSRKAMAENIDRINLGRRMVLSSESECPFKGDLYCGILGGVFHMQPGDVLYVHGSTVDSTEFIADNFEILMAEVNVCNPSRTVAPRVVMLAERGKVSNLKSEGCTLTFCGPGTMIEGCWVNGRTKAIGFDIVEPSKSLEAVEEGITVKDCETSQALIGLAVRGYSRRCFVHDSRCVLIFPHYILDMYRHRDNKSGFREQAFRRPVLSTE